MRPSLPLPVAAVFAAVLAGGLAACADPTPPDPLPDDGAAAEAPAPPPPPAPEAFTPASPPADSVWVGDPPTRIPGPYRVLPDGWTTGTVDLERPDRPSATLVALRTARQDGYDRVVFEFDGPVPGLHTEYVDTPVYTCGAGEALRLEGDGWLRVTFQPARAHTDAGAATVTERRAQPALPNLREYAVTCDFEADLTVILGLAAPTDYRLLELTDPHRLVVDVRHDG